MRLFLFSLLSMLYLIVSAQSTQTVDVKIPYSNGLELFTVCKLNPKISYVDSIDYYWYNEYSGVKSTKGGSGGALLHGNYKFFDKEGNILLEQNYSLGVLNGIEKRWDEKGEIIGTYKYIMGKVVYLKYLNDEGYWVEIVGDILSVGSVKNVYDEYNRLLTSEKFLSFSSSELSIYDKVSGKITMKVDKNIFDRYIGKYIKYYENGKIKISGQYLDGIYDTDLMTGTWKWYNENGSLDFEIQYQPKIEYWSNGNFKSIGSLELSQDENNWEKTGWWIWYEEDGKTILRKQKYEQGVQVNY